MMCLHKRFLQQYQSEMFPDVDGMFSAVGTKAVYRFSNEFLNRNYYPLPKTDVPSVVLFSRQPDDNADLDCFVNIFSVSTPGRHWLNSLCVVSHDGPDNGNGVWKCSKDRSVAGDCVHMQKARDHLRKLVGGNRLEMDDEGQEVARVIGRAVLGMSKSLSDIQTIRPT
jgi:hypothetical protein